MAMTMDVFELEKELKTLQKKVAEQDRRIKILECHVKGEKSKAKWKRGKLAKISGDWIES
jgi:hypothetical protein